MLSSVDFSGRPFHFIGIGGIGMSALAYVLLERQLPVSGSDLRLNHITERLQSLGAQIFPSQSAANLEFLTQAMPPRADLRSGGSGSGAAGVAIGAPTLTPIRQTGSEQRASSLLPQVICSTAINPSNPEYQAAIALGCPILHRSDLLAALIQNTQSVAVAGTHGKTTTSSLISYLLLEADLDPTVIVGGEVSAWQGNARVGQSQYLVAEADESDGSLVKFAPQIGVITNIELDHPDHYSTLDEVVDIFKTFADRCHTVVGCLDCETVRDRIQPQVTYSLSPLTGADYTVGHVTYHAEGTSAQVWEQGQILGDLKLRLLGQHNLSNALAAVAVGRLLGIEFRTIAAAIAKFEGARRRFEHRGTANHILFVDDYAHHPSEIRATLASAKLQAAKTLSPRRIVAVFQPHRYSRTLTFLSEFSESFSDADRVILGDIYSAGEVNSGQINGQTLVDAIANHHHDVHYCPTMPEISAFLEATLQPGDLVIFLGAGNLNQIIPEVMAQQRRSEKAVS